VPNTLKAYAHDDLVKHFFTFLGERWLGWQRVTPADLGSFTAEDLRRELEAAGWTWTMGDVA
jgi:hypothetical protein